MKKITLAASILLALGLSACERAPSTTTVISPPASNTVTPVAVPVPVPVAVPGPAGQPGPEGKPGEKGEPGKTRTDTVIIPVPAPEPRR